MYERILVPADGSGTANAGVREAFISRHTRYRLYSFGAPLVANAMTREIMTRVESNRHAAGVRQLRMARSGRVPRGKCCSWVLLRIALVPQHRCGIGSLGIRTAHRGSARFDHRIAAALAR